MTNRLIRFSLLIAMAFAAAVTTPLAQQAGTTKPAPPAPAAAAPQVRAATPTSDIPRITFEKYTLPNGLDVILRQDRRLPVVAVDLWYHVGPANEEKVVTGSSAVFEATSCVVSINLVTTSLWRSVGRQ